MPERAVYNILVADSDVTDLVYYEEATSRYAIAPEETPALEYTITTGMIVYSLDATEPVHHLTGPAGIAMATVVLDMYVRTYTGVKDLAQKVRTALDGQTGTHGTVDVRGIQRVNESGAIEVEISNSTQRFYLITQTFEVWYVET